jgi:glycosyltransferase involved in cell wall biosynthesis
MNILFIAYYFPPSNAAGAARAKSLAKYLAREGDSVTVLTVPSQLFGFEKNWLPPDLAGLPITRIEVRPPIPQADPHFKDFTAIDSKILGGITRRAMRLLSKEPESLWYWASIKTIRTLLKSFDVVIATGSPWVSFHIGHTAAKELNVPLVLDYRDLWTDNPYKLRWPRREVRHENRLLAAADGVSGVSKGILATLQPRIANSSRTYVCENGFDPDEFQSVIPSSSPKFTIIYAGTFYPPKISWAPLLDSLKSLFEIDSLRGKWEFRYIGTWSDVVEQQIKRFHLESHAAISGYVPRREALNLLAGADLGVVITSVLERGSPADLGIVTSKIFDLLALRRRILLIAPDGSEAEGFITRFGTGVRFNGNQTAEITNYIAECIRARTQSAPTQTTPDNRGCTWPAKIRAFRDFLSACIQAHPRHKRGGN